MIESTGLFFTIIGVVTVIVLILELVLDVDTFSGKIFSKLKKSRSRKIEAMDEEMDENKKLQD